MTEATVQVVIVVDYNITLEDYGTTDAKEVLELEQQNMDLVDVVTSAEKTSVTWRLIHK